MQLLAKLRDDTGVLRVGSRLICLYITKQGPMSAVMQVWEPYSTHVQKDGVSFS